MGEPCHNWFSDTEKQDDDFFNKHKKINSLDVEGGSSNTTITNYKGGNNNFVLKNYNNINDSSMISNIFSQRAPMKPSTSTSPTTTYVLSFGDSTIVAATTSETNSGKQPYHIEQVQPSKGVVAKHDEFEPKAKETKKCISSTKTLDHVMAERKRRRELTERFIELSATIPGLKKIDKSTILSQAITHVKELKQRVRELEEQKKNIIVESSVSFIWKSHITNEEGSAMTLPTVEARVLKKDVLIRIHCKKQSDIVLKILGHIKSLGLFTISNSVLPFGNSTLDVSITAQMGDKFNITTNDLVKNLRQAILESPETQQ